MFVALVVPQNIFFNAKSVKVRISLRTDGNNIQFCQKVYENVNNVETL